MTSDPPEPWLQGLPSSPRVRDLSIVSAASKDSSVPPSVSQSNEADDERSSDEHSMGPDRSVAMTERPLYDGEDVRLTSARELRGFFMYGWAAEVRTF